MADDEGIPHTHGRWTRSDTPPSGSKTERFVDLVRRDHGEDFVASWLLPHLMIRMADGTAGFQNCEFTPDTIWTTGVGADRLNRACEHLIEKADITVRECPQIRARFAAWGRKYRAPKTPGARK